MKNLLSAFTFIIQKTSNVAFQPNIHQFIFPEGMVKDGPGIGVATFFA